MHQTICVSYCSSLPANVTPGPAQRERAHCVTHTEPGLQPCMQCPAALWPSPSHTPTHSHPRSPLTFCPSWCSWGWCGGPGLPVLVLVCGDQLSVQCPVSSQRQPAELLRHLLPLCGASVPSLHRHAPPLSTLL